MAFCVLDQFRRKCCPLHLARTSSMRVSLLPCSALSPPVIFHLKSHGSLLDYPRTDDRNSLRRTLGNVCPFWPLIPWQNNTLGITRALPKAVRANPVSQRRCRLTVGGPETHTDTHTFCRYKIIVVFFQPTLSIVFPTLHRFYSSLLCLLLIDLFPVRSSTAPNPAIWFWNTSHVARRNSSGYLFGVIGRSALRHYMELWGS